MTKLKCWGIMQKKKGHWKTIVRNKDRDIILKTSIHIYGPYKIKKVRCK